MNFLRSLKNIGGKATRPGLDKAATISLGSNRTVRHMGRGSSSGLNAHKPAYLQPNGSGYANPAIHHNKNKVKSYPSFSGLPNNGRFMSGQTLHSVNDFTKPKYLTDR